MEDSAKVTRCECGEYETCRWTSTTMKCPMLLDVKDQETADTDQPRVIVMTSVYVNGVERLRSVDSTNTDELQFVGEFTHEEEGNLVAYMTRTVLSITGPSPETGVAWSPARRTQ